MCSLWFMLVGPALLFLMPVEIIQVHSDSFSFLITKASCMVLHRCLTSHCSNVYSVTETQRNKVRTWFLKHSTRRTN